MSAFSANHVPLAYEPPNSNPTICGYFSIVCPIKSQAFLAIRSFCSCNFFGGVASFFAEFKIDFIAFLSQPTDLYKLVH